MIVYKTTNKINGKIYVGQTVNNRDDYLGSGKLIKYAIKKYGSENFMREILFENEYKDEINKQEIYWIEKLNARDGNIGYNIHTGGWGGYNKRAVEANRKRKGRTLKETCTPEGYEKHLKTVERLKASGHYKRIGELNRGKTPWNKGMKGEYTMKESRSEESRERSRQALLNSEKAKASRIIANSGDKLKKKQKKNSELSTVWWQDENYRKKVMEARKKSPRGQKAEQKRKQAKELFAQGITKTEIGKIMNVSIQLVSFYIKTS